MLGLKVLCYNILLEKITEKLTHIYFELKIIQQVANISQERILKLFTVRLLPSASSLSWISTPTKRIRSSLLMKPTARSNTSVQFPQS